MSNIAVKFALFFCSKISNCNIRCHSILWLDVEVEQDSNKMLSYHRETVLQSGTVRYSFGQKWKTGPGIQYFMDIIGLSSTTVT